MNCEAIKLCLCQNFRNETDALLSRSPDLSFDVHYYKSRNNCDPLEEEEYGKILEKNFHYKRVFVLGGLCFDPGQFSSHESMTVVPLSSCYSMFCPQYRIDSFIASGAFIVSPGWLENWKNHPRKKDLIGAQKNLKFSDSIKKIVLFDTGVSDDSKDRLRSLASHLSRPYEVLAVNIEYFQGYLKSLFKIGKEKKSPNKLIPICSECHKIRDEKGVWHQEVNTRETHAHREYTHGLCRECADKIYGQKEWYKRNKQREKE